MHIDYKSSCLLHAQTNGYKCIMCEPLLSSTTTIASSSNQSYQKYTSYFKITKMQPSTTCDLEKDIRFILGKTYWGNSL